jgi:hypothetical protein
VTLAQVSAGYDFRFRFDRRAPLLLGLLAFLITSWAKHVHPPCLHRCQAPVLGGAATLSS